MDIHIGNAAQGLCFLLQTDSTLAVGWIQKSNFGDVNPMHLKVTRAMAYSSWVMHKSTVYSQWFEGILNEVADALSRDHNLPDEKLLNLFHSLILDFKQFQNLSFAARYCLENYDLAAATACHDAVTKGTTAKQAGY
jgi:hypothetical protein